MFLETSARTAYNVEEAFNLSAQNILSNIEKNKMNLEDTVIKFFTLQKTGGVKLAPQSKVNKGDGKGPCC